MLRIAVPYGVLTTTQFRKLSDIGRKYDKGYGHFTTRQNLQFNWIKLKTPPPSWVNWRKWTCMPSRPAATACAT